MYTYIYMVYTQCTHVTVTVPFFQISSGTSVGPGSRAARHPRAPRTPPGVVRELWGSGSLLLEQLLNLQYTYMIHTYVYMYVYVYIGMYACIYTYTYIPFCFIIYPVFAFVHLFINV